MRKLSIILILTSLNFLYTPKAHSQLYPGNAYYDSTGKVYYYATDGKAYYYPEHVQRQYQKKPQTRTVRRVSTQQNTKQHKNSYQKQNTARNSMEIPTKDKNLLNANWWKTATLEKVKQEIANGANVKAKANDRAGQNSDGDLRTNVTPLMFALKYATPSVEIVETLIKAGADVNTKEGVVGLTPLMYAAEKNVNIGIINLLLQNGADVNAKTNDGWTVLMRAAEYNENAEVIKILIDAGANVNAKDDDWTALMYAAKNSTNSDVIKALIDAGADVNAKDDDGWTALMMAAEYNENAEIVKILIDAGADVNAKNDNGNTAMMRAAFNNKNPEIIKILIDAGADVNANTKTKVGGTALIAAAMKNTNPEVIKTLLDSGANINACIENYGFITAAFYALGINPNHKIFELLVKKDIDNFCKVNRSYSEEIYYCKDRLTLYMQKEASLPSCTKNPSAMLAIFPFLQGLQYIDSDKGTYTLVVFADRMSHFNCSISKTFKEMHFYDFE